MWKPPTALLRKCERLQIDRRQKKLACKAVVQTHLPMALLAQRHRDWGCLLVLPPQTSNVAWEWEGSLPGSFRSPAPKMRTSADSWQAEGASLESCCSASCAHGTARTEAQRLGLLACLAISGRQRRPQDPNRAPRTLTEPQDPNRAPKTSEYTPGRQQSPQDSNIASRTPAKPPGPQQSPQDPIEDPRTQQSTQDPSEDPRTPAKTPRP